MRIISLRIYISLPRVSVCPQTDITLGGFALYSLLESSQPNSTWNLMAANSMGWKKHFPCLFHMVQALEDSGASVSLP